MKQNATYKNITLSVIFTVLSYIVANAQYLLQAPNNSDEHNYQWFEASDTEMVLGTDSFLEVAERGVYFATYDGTLCGANATGYFIVTNCNSPFNEVTLDVTANVPANGTISWNPSLPGDQSRPTVIATQTVEKYTAIISKAGNDKALPNFTVVCINEAANLLDDMVTTDEDQSIVIPIFDNDSDLPTTSSIASTIGNTSTSTVAVLQSPKVLHMVYVKESCPLKSGLGM